MDVLCWSGWFDNVVVVFLLDYGEDFDLVYDKWLVFDVEVLGGIVNGYGGLVIWEL